jgi:hypothetical protein
MPPKSTISYLQSPRSDNKSSDDGLRRSDRNRRPSAENLHAIASEADMSSLDANSSSNRGGGHGSISSGSRPSTATTSTAGITAEEIVALRTIFARLPDLPAASSTVQSRGNGGSTGGTLNPTAQRLVGGLGNVVTPALPSASILGVSSDVGVGTNAEGSDDDEVTDDEGDSKVRVHPPKSSVGELRWGGLHVSYDNRWAIPTVAEVKTYYHSFRGRALADRCRDIRNKFEVDTLSTICDAALEGRCDVILELAVRRIYGVEQADQGGGRDWDTATALDLSRPGAFGSDELRRQARKEAARVKAAKPKQATSGPRRSGGSNGGKVGRSRYKDKKGHYNKSGSGAKSTATSG